MVVFSYQKKSPSLLEWGLWTLSWSHCFTGNVWGCDRVKCEETRPLNAVQWEASGRAGQAVERAWTPPNIWSGAIHTTACLCLLFEMYPVHSNQWNKEQRTHFGVPAQVLLASFLCKWLICMPCERSTSNLGPRKKNIRKKKYFLKIKAEQNKQQQKKILNNFLKQMLFFYLSMFNPMTVCTNIHRQKYCLVIK